MNSERLVECEDEVYEKVTFVSLILILFTAGWCAGAERMRIGYSSISGSYLGIWVAHDAGYFAKEKLDDQIILIPSGSQLAQVVTAGEVDIAALNGRSAMAAALQGADIKIIGNTTNKLIFFHLCQTGDQDDRGSQREKDRCHAVSFRH